MTQAALKIQVGISVVYGLKQKQKQKQNSCDELEGLVEHLLIHTYIYIYFVRVTHRSRVLRVLEAIMKDDFFRIEGLHIQ